MRIAMFSESFLPYVSGVTLSIFRLCQALGSSGHHIDLFVPNYPPAEQVKTEKMEAAGEEKHAVHKTEDAPVSDALPRTVCLYRFPSLPSHRYPKYRLALPFSKEIQAVRTRTAYDIVHTHSPFQLGWVARRTARQKRVPLVLSFHTMLQEYLHYVPFLPKRITWPVLRYYLRSFCHACDQLIVPSAPVGQLLEEMGIKTPTLVVPTGVPAQQPDSAPQAQTNIRTAHLLESCQVLLYVGRISQEKNIDFLLTTLAPLLKATPSLRFMLVGNGPYTAALHQQAQQLAIAPQVVFVGSLPPDQVFAYYHASDVFVFASQSETQGLVLAEAKSCGLPVVALEGPGVSQTVANEADGFLIPSHNADLFREKVTYLLAHPEVRATFSQNARQWASQAWDTTHMAEKVLSLYHTLCKK